MTLPLHSLNELATVIHQKNLEAGWWSDLKTGQRIERNVGELLCLVHSELTEAWEGHADDLNDDKLPHRKMFEVELADAQIRLLDIAGAYACDLEAPTNDIRITSLESALLDAHRDVSRAMEGNRKNKSRDGRKVFDIEIANAFAMISAIGDFTGADVPGAIAEKVEFNAKREDHKIAHRLSDNGKKY